MTPFDTPVDARPREDGPLGRGSATLVADPVDGAGVPCMTLRAFLDLAGQLLRGLPDTIWIEASIIACKAGRLGHTLELGEAGGSSGQSGALRVFLPAAVLTRLAAQLGGPVDPEPLVGTTTLLKLSPHFHARYHLGARVLDLGREATLSLQRHRVAQLREALKREGLFDRQRRLPKPLDVTRIAVIHPVGAAGYADIADELARWQRAGLIALRSHPAVFEGEAAPEAIARATTDAVAPLRGFAPDLVLMVRGGGARAGLEMLDHAAIVRAVARCPVPVVCGLGHAVDRCLVDDVAWQSCDTPSKTLAVVAALMRTPAEHACRHRAALVSLGERWIAEAALGLATRDADVRLRAGERMRHSAATLAALGADLRVVAVSAEARCRSLIDQAGQSFATIAFDADHNIDDAARSAEAPWGDAIGAAERRLTMCDSGERTVASIVHLAGTAVDRAISTLDQLKEAVRDAASQRLDRTVDALAATEAVVSASSLESTLRRGFALVTTFDGTVVRGVTAARAARDLTLILADGTVAAVVEP